MGDDLILVSVSSERYLVIIISLLLNDACLIMNITNFKNLAMSSTFPMQVVT